MKKNREDLLELVGFSPKWVGSDDQKDNSIYSRYVSLLLMLEVFDNSEKWKSLYYKIYCRLVSNKVNLIEHEIKARKDLFERMLSFGDHWRGFSYGSMTASSLGSGNLRMMTLVKMIPQLLLDCKVLVGTMNEFENLLKYCVSTNADRIYFSQFLLFNDNLKQAISILKDVVEQEGDFSISMVIWPKELYASHLLDENLRNELIKSSEDYIVFPTNLYARYLLTIAYSSLGQDENASNNLAELIVLLDRYSQVQEFVPMLEIMSTVVGCSIYRT